MVSIPAPEISISSKDKQQLSDTTSQDSTSVVQPVYTSLFDSSFVSAISTPTFTPTFSIPSVSSDISAISDTVSTEKTTQSIVSTNQASVSQTSSTVSEAQSVVSTPTISSVPVSSVVPTSSSTVSAIEDPNVSSTLLSVISTPPVSTSVSAVVSEKPSQVVSNTDVLVSTLTTSSTPPASASNPPVSVSTPPVSVSTPDVSVSAPVSNAASTVIAPPSSTSTPVVSSVPIPQISTQETPVSGVASTTLSNIVPSSVATDTNTFPISSIITPSVAASSVQSNTDILQPVSTISTLPNTVSGISSVTTNDVPTQSQITVPSSIPNTLPVTPSSVEAVTLSLIHILHSASPMHGQNKEIYDLVNVKGTRNVIDVCKNTNVNILVYTSSAGVIFNGQDVHNADERWPIPEVPMDAYNETKFTAEDMVLKSNDPENGFLTVALRPAGIFGPGDRQLVPGLRAVAKLGQSKFQLGDNNNLFDWTYAGNVADSHVLAAQRLLDPATAKEVSGEAFFITNDTPTYFWSLARTVWKADGHIDKNVIVLKRPVAILAGYLSEFFSKLLGKEPGLTPFRVKIVCASRYHNIAKAKKLLGYEPRVDIEEGIKRTLAWMDEDL